MPIAVSCKACGIKFNVPDHLAGRTAKCKCGGALAIPAAVPAAVGATTGRPAPAAPRPGTKPPQPAGDGWIDINHEYIPAGAATASAGPPTGDWGQALIEPHGVNAEMQEQIRTALTRNERLVWFDRPRQDVLMSRARRAAIGAFFGLLLSLTVPPGIGWVMIEQGRKDPNNQLGPYIGAGVAGIVTVFLTIGCIFMMFTPGRVRRGAALRPCYMLTNRRVLIHPGMGMQTAMSQSGRSAAVTVQSGDRLPSFSGPEMFNMTRLEDPRFEGVGEIMLGLSIFDELVGGGLAAVGNVAQVEKLFRAQLVHPIVDKLLRGELSLKGEFGRVKDQEAPAKEDAGEELPTEGNLKTFAGQLPTDPANVKTFKSAVTQDLTTATPEQRKQVEAELAEGEKVLWIGAPEGGGGIMKSLGMSGGKHEPKYTLYAITNRRVILWSSKGSRDKGGIRFGRLKKGPVSYYPPRLLGTGVEDVNKSTGNIVFRKVKVIIDYRDNKGHPQRAVQIHSFGLLRIRNVQAVARLLFDTLIRPCKAV